MAGSSLRSLSPRDGGASSYPIPHLHLAKAPFALCGLRLLRVQHLGAVGEDAGGVQHGALFGLGVEDLEEPKGMPAAGGRRSCPSRCQVPSSRKPSQAGQVPISAPSAPGSPPSPNHSGSSAWTVTSTELKPRAG